MNTKEKCGFQEGVRVPDPDTADIEYHVEGLYVGRQVEEYQSKTVEEVERICLRQDNTTSHHDL